MEFIVNRPAVDYLTVTTYSERVFGQTILATHTSQEAAEATDDGIKRYQGKRFHHPGGSIFFGEGQQKQQDSETWLPHFVMSASGAAADKFSTYWAGQDLMPVSVTRVDCQLTLPLPDWYKSHSLLKTLRTGEWKGRKPLCTMIDNYGDDTVYIGSKSSDRRARIYVKERGWLRVEYQYRKDYAESAFSNIRASPNTGCAGTLVSELIKWPEHPVKNIFLEQLKLANTQAVKAAKPEKSMSRRYRWFTRQILPAIETMLHDHDIGGKVRDDLLGVMEKCGKNGQDNNS